MISLRIVRLRLYLLVAVFEELGTVGRTVSDILELACTLIRTAGGGRAACWAWE